jgi:hypothetical protein
MLFAFGRALFVMLSVDGYHEGYPFLRKLFRKEVRNADQPLACLRSIPLVLNSRP